MTHRYSNTENPDPPVTHEWPDLAQVYQKKN